MPPLAEADRGCGNPENQCTVSIWWLIHCPGSPEEYGQKSRNSRYFRGSKGSNGLLSRYRFQSVSSSFSCDTRAGRRQRPGWLTFQVSSTMTIGPNLPDPI